MHGGNLITDLFKNSYIEISIFINFYLHLCMCYKLMPKYHRLYVISESFLLMFSGVHVKEVLNLLGIMDLFRIWWKLDIFLFKNVYIHRWHPISDNLWVQLKNLCSVTNTWFFQRGVYEMCWTSQRKMSQWAYWMES